MNAQLMQSIVEGNPAVTISVTASDLRSIVLEIVRQERERITAALAKSREHGCMSRRQAANALGIHVSTLDRWATEGYVSPVKIGTKVLYRESDISAMMAGNNY